jgi:acyl carrier protein
MRTDAELTSTVIRIVAQHFGACSASVDEATHLHNHFDADDFDRIEVALEVESEFGVILPDQEFHEFETVGDLVAAVRRQLARQQAA